MTHYIDQWNSLTNIEKRILNLFFFYCLYNGVSGNKLKQQSPDYLLEKWNCLIKTKSNDLNFKSLLFSNDTFLVWNKIWKGYGLIPDNILIFIVETSEKKLKISNLVSYFEKYCGDFSEISTDYYPTHFLLQEHVSGLVQELIQNEEQFIRHLKIKEILK
jgi:hypothetical protein